MTTLKIRQELINKFIFDTKNKYPKKAFGYFISDEPGGSPVDYIMFENNIRNDWRGFFEEYGNYYKKNQDAGFLATPEETYHVEKYLRQNNMFKVGVFHSHQRHPAIFSKVDCDLHPEKDLWHLIISLRNIDMPQVRIFKVCNDMSQEIPIRLI